LDRGQLLLAPFPYSDLRGLKRRPVCVVSSSAYSQGPDVIVAMVTSNQTRVAHPGLGDIALQDWQQAGLRQPSVVRCGRLLVIEHRLLRTGLGQLSEPDLAAVDTGLKIALGLP
jgi:mRNA-degrading endonuclease toxin of MazEF toxin-antitoxin module